MPVIHADRAPHWIKPNHQCRIPKRWVAFDTEARFSRDIDIEVQQWRLGTAIRWRTDLKTGDHAERESFDNPTSMWTWITDYCRKETRTFAFAHNLGYDVRISGALDILPALGWELEWSNLDRSVSSMTWRSERGTLVLADMYTWLPVPLSSVGGMVGVGKLSMPGDGASLETWRTYCMNDTDIVYRAMSEIKDYVQTEGLGNFQPTGAGMAYSTWRHKHLEHQILVHDDVDVLAAERAAMHTGRAEAWRHGEILGERWTELDLKNAYVTIARDYELPTRLRFKTGSLSMEQYTKLCDMYRVLCKVRVTTDLPVVPCQHEGRTIWPVGTFTTWLWDCEIDALLSEGQSVRIIQGITYTREFILREWAQWVLGLIDKGNDGVSPVIKTWAKHSGRALIGRISLRTPRWDYWGGNPNGNTGISYLHSGSTDRTQRLLHIGSKTFIETERIEGRDSLPQVTSWIMAQCRVRLWTAMRTAGLESLAHVDTDSLILSKRGLQRLRERLPEADLELWATKGSWATMEVYGPRTYRVGRTRRISGVPVRAEETPDGRFAGEKWTGVAGDIERGNAQAVTVVPWVWTLTRRDPRRVDSPGVPTYTDAIRLT